MYNLTFWACVVAIAGMVAFTLVSPEFEPVAPTGRSMP